jgi:hypothetical protein
MGRKFLQTLGSRLLFLMSGLMTAVLKVTGTEADCKLLFTIFTSTGSKMSRHANTILVGTGSISEEVALALETILRN